VSDEADERTRSEELTGPRANDAPDPPEVGGVQVPCRACGAMLEYTPGTSELNCPHCGGTTRIEAPPLPVDEQDYTAALARLADEGETMSVRTMTCRSCGATTELMPEVAADHCPYCGSHYNVTAETARVIKPNAILPFSIARTRVDEFLMTWIRSRWFAPNALKRDAEKERVVNGMYLPHWTYDSATTTSYQGWRGDYYYVTVGSGKNRVQQRRTRWSPRQGVVSRRFDDVLVPASTSPLTGLASQLGGWDLSRVVPYDNRYVAGFLSEVYRVDLPTGFETAKGIMAATIEGDIRISIGGDTQRIDARRTAHNEVMFKHLLLPLWVGAFRYRGKVYRFVINGRTGGVVGERPWSWIKITLTALAAAAAGFTIAFIASQR